ncbi:serine carboxypeptidase-like 26 isoform X3 [Oryza glaberrima]|uniref:serine carboxypeptidase-like 26 isoform X3 n=1 Tax=Oryza glaberrima TaxID=4538 RepID=UPI00224C0EE0|nr:serine carboxypeptidase-like 26 isoform X3 [Oryza glaberrima]
MATEAAATARWLLLPLLSPPQSPHKQQQLIFGALLLLFFFSSLQSLHCNAAAGYNEQQEADRVAFLPGQPSSPKVSQFSGYITVNRQNGRALFYWFFEAQALPSQKPLLLWLNGGPGCSSVGYGAASELGPLRVSRNGAGLEFNKFAWNKEANLLFLESPVGVGFSYTNTSSDLTKLNDGFVAEDAYNFLVNWLDRFPQYKDHEFYISGESYAGHYVPQLADLVYERNKDKKANRYIKLKGFIVGNPLTDDQYDSKGLVEYAWSHAVVSDGIYERVNKVCNFKISNWTSDCNEAMSNIFRQYQEIDIYNIYAPKCNLAQTSRVAAFDHALEASDQEQFSRRIRMFSGYDACYSSYAEKYFNKPDVQKAFHANGNGMLPGKWKVCRGITYEDALNSSRIKFCNRWFVISDKACATKHLWWKNKFILVKYHLIWCLHPKYYRWCMIDKICCCHYYLTPQEFRFIHSIHQ